MKDIHFVTADEIETLEQYAASLVTAIISVRSLEAFQINAFKRGLFKQDEEECSKTICWELRRLMNLYLQQMQSVLDRTELTEKEILKELKKISGIKPKTKKVKNEQKSF